MDCNFKLCVICPGDGDAAVNLAYSLLTREDGVRLVLCTDNADAGKFPKPAETGRLDFAHGSLEAVNSVLASPDAPLVMFAEPNTTDGAAVFNAAESEIDAPRKLYRDSFSEHEAFSPAVGVNFVMRSEVISEHKMELLSADAAGFAAFAAEYAAYESFKPLHEVLLYGAKPKNIPHRPSALRQKASRPRAGSPR